MTFHRLSTCALALSAVLAGSIPAHAGYLSGRTPAPKSHYADKLTPVDSGNGVVIGEPVPAHASETTAEFGAACSYWLQVVVGGDGRMGKTPPLAEIAEARRREGKPNLRIAPVAVPNFAKRLGITHAATAVITGDSSTCRLTYLLTTVTGQPVGKPIVLTGSYARILRGLGAAASTMVARLHGDGHNIPAGVAATPADMIVLGQNLSDWDAPTTARQIEQWKQIVPRTSIAGMFLVGNGVTDPAIVDATVRHAGGNAMILSYVRPRLSDHTESVDNAIDKARSKFPNNYALLELDTNKYLVRGSYEMARATAERAVEAAPKNPSSWLYLGDALEVEVMLMRQSTPDDKNTDLEAQEARIYADREAVVTLATKLDPDNANAWSDLSEAAAYDGDAALAVKALDKSIALDPSSERNVEWGLDLYGPDWLDDSAKRLDIATTALKPEFARSTYTKVLDAYKDTPGKSPIREQITIPALKVAADVIADDGNDPSKSVSTALFDATAHPDDEAVWLRLSDAASVAGNRIRHGVYWSQLTPAQQAAMPVFYTVQNTANQIAVDIKPTDINAWLRLSKAQAFQSDGQEAIASLNQALKLDPNSIPAYKWSLQIYQPKWGGELPDLMTTIDTLQTKPDAYVKLSLEVVQALQASMGNGSPTPEQTTKANAQLATAKSALDNLLTHPQDSASPWDMAYYLEQNNRLEEATAEYEIGVSQSPEDNDLRFALASIYYRRKLWNQAVDAYQEVLKREPDQDQALFFCGVLLVNEQHKTKDGEAMLRHLIRVKPNSARAYHWLGVALQNEGDMPAARRAWMRSVQLDPDNKDEGGAAKQLLDANPGPMN